MKFTDELKARLAYIIVVGLFLAVFFFGYWTRGYLDHSGGTADTTAVQVKPPPAQTVVAIPATIVQKVVYKDRIVPDSTALMESAWLQNENATLKDQIDTLMAQKDSLRARLNTLLAPHTATVPFKFDLLEGKGWLKLTAEQAYVPMKEQFGLALTPTELYLPEITITKHPAWWVKPVVFIGGLSTAYFIQQKNSTGALISGGASTILLFVEF